VGKSGGGLKFCEKYFLSLKKNKAMDNLVIENKKNHLILKLNKKGFNKEYLISLVKRLQVEELAQKSNFSSDILSIAEQINQEWWDNKKDNFLKEVLI
jgi:hypothetical protein